MLTDDEIEERVKRIKEWLCSEKGRQAMRRASERSKMSAKDRAEKRRVDWRELMERDG